MSGRGGRCARAQTEHMDFYRKILTKLDYSLLISVAAILGISLFVLQSATTHLSGSFVMKQLIWIGVGVVVILISLRFDYSILKKYYKHLYALNVLMLIAVYTLADSTKGARSWFNLPGGLGKIQPAEMGKIIIIICLAQFLVERKDKLKTFKDLIPVFIFTAVPTLLVLIQPDLGTALVYVAIMIGMLYIAGANWKLLTALFGGGIAAAVGYIWGIWKFGWPSPLEAHQLNRFLVLFDPNIDRQGIGWNVRQAKIAIGNGGLLGQGLGSGSQSSGQFLPEQWTDFIFAVFAEELGFIGVAVLLVLFVFMLYRCVRIAMSSKDVFGSLIATGVMTMYLFHIVENVGMNIGLMPVTGIPLPFVSYGGSAMLTNFMGLALLLNVYVRRQKLIF